MHQDALRREADATQWYLQLPGLLVGASACTVCPTGPLDAAGVALRARRDGKSKTAQAAVYPRALETRYRAQLRRRVRDTHRVTLQAIRSALVPLQDDINARARGDALGLAAVAGTTDPQDLHLATLLAQCRLDSPATDRRRLLQVISQVEKAVAKASPVQLELLFSLAQQVQRHTTRSVTSQVLTVTGIDVLPTLGEGSALLGHWAREQAKLIRSLDSRYFAEISDAAVQVVTKGQPTRALSKAIAERYGVARSRADLIAVDQVGTLNAKITQERQTRLGIDEYIWDDSSDQRVRPLHRSVPGGLGGTRRRWDDPHPTEGHPGFPIRCRCSALAVF